VASQGDLGPFESDAWGPALAKYGAVTGLTVELYGADERPVCGPVHVTPLFGLFADRQYDPGLRAACLRRCLDATDGSAGVIAEARRGIAVVGTPLRLSGRTVGACVAGYALTEFPRAHVVDVWARESGLGVEELRQVVRRSTPLPRSRLVQHGELLQSLGDAILRETDHTRRHREASERLAEAVRVRDMFLAMASHELRTPLTAALGVVRLLKKALAGTLRQTPEVLIEVASRNLAVAVDLLNDLLDASKLANGPASVARQPVALAAAVDRSLAVVSADAHDKRITLQVQVPTELRVSADPLRLEQVLLNLLVNAVKFTAPGGTVAVEASASDSEVTVRVRDTGMGIATEHLEQIFEPFYQVHRHDHRRPRGTGLGLAICRQIVALHGGRIWAESQGSGRGSTFVVTLPRVQEPGEATGPSAIPTRPRTAAAS
jgi:signal transduction histidine kinase